jgi:hypothetical protein
MRVRVMMTQSRKFNGFPKRQRDKETNSTTKNSIGKIYGLWRFQSSRLRSNVVVRLESIIYGRNLNPSPPCRKHLDTTA